MGRIGVDLDGVFILPRVGWFNTDLKLPWWIFLGLIFVRPNRKAVEILKKLDERDIIFVSARPKELENWTIRSLRFYKVPFSHLFCVGLGKGVAQRKLEVIRRMGIEKFIDNDEEVVNFLRNNSIDAHLPGELFAGELFE